MVSEVVGVVEVLDVFTKITWRWWDIVEVLGTNVMCEAVLGECCMSNWSNRLLTTKKPYCLGCCIIFVGCFCQRNWHDIS